jgi:hypothetical protein
VTFTAGGQTVLTRTAVGDKGPYHVGKGVTVLYDPAKPTHVVLATDRYDAETPFLFWSAVATGGLLPILFGWWWVRRVRRLAEGPGTAFAVRATVADLRPGRWNRRRRYVTLHALDAHLPPLRPPTPGGATAMETGLPAPGPTEAGPPVPGSPEAGPPVPGSPEPGPTVPPEQGALVPDPATHRPIGSYLLMTGVVLDPAVGLHAEAKGDLRAGGLVVARVGDEVAWPRRRLRA